MQVQVIKKEDSIIGNTIMTLKEFKGNRLKKMFLRIFPHAHYTKAPFGFSMIAKGMYIDSRTGAKMLEKFNGEFVVD